MDDEAVRRLCVGHTQQESRIDDDRCPNCGEDPGLTTQRAIVDARARRWCGGCASSALASIAWSATGAAELLAAAAEVLRKPATTLRAYVEGERCPSTNSEWGNALRCDLAIGHGGNHYHRQPHGTYGWNDAPPPEQLRQLRASFEAEEEAKRAELRRLDQEAAERERLQRAEREKVAQQRAAETPPAAEKPPTTEEEAADPDGRRFELLEVW
jgi:hypothetical protein